VARRSAPGTGNVQVGNADEIVRSDQNMWLIGSFVKDDTFLRHSDSVEVKWGRHPKGETRDGVSACSPGTSLAILISGSFLFKFPDGFDNVVLDAQGDYVVYGSDVAHTWEALDDSLILTIRWEQ
jgi:hypothetical protein